MKTFACVLLLFVSSVTAWAQHETLFGRTRVVGGFGALLTEIRLGGHGPASSLGAGGGVVIDQFFLGFYGVGSVDFDQLIDESNNIDRIELAHGGLWLGFQVPSHKLIHVYGSTRLGWGAVNISVDDPNLRYDDVDKIFAITPEIGLELNLTRWLRLSGAASYRFVQGVDESLGYTRDDFQGSLATVGLRIGGFGRKRY